MLGVGNCVKSLPAEQRQRIESGYSKELLHALYETDQNAWHPIAVWKEALDVIVASSGDPKVARTTVRSAGRFICERTVNTFLKLLMRIMTPALFAKKSGSMIGKDFRGFVGGAPDYFCDLSKLDQKEITMGVRRAADFPYLGGTGQGFIEFAMHYMGMQDVLIDEPGCAPDEWAPENVSWRIRWK